MYAAILAVEGAKSAQAIHGVSKITPSMMRDGLEALEITEENAVYQYGLIVKLLGFLAAVVSLTFTVIVYDTIEIAHGGSSLLGAWFIPALVIPIFGSMIWYFIAAFRGR